MQAEAALQQVSHPGGYGKLTPNANQMPPPGMQQRMNPHMMGMANAQQQQVQQQPNQNQMGGQMVQNQGGNMMQNMNQWGGDNRYPNNGNNPGLRSPNPSQIIGQGGQMAGAQVIK